MNDDIEFLKKVFGVTEGSAYEGKRVRYNGETDDTVANGAVGTVQFQDGDGDLCVLIDGNDSPVGFRPDEVSVLDE